MRETYRKFLTHRSKPRVKKSSFENFVVFVMCSIGATAALYLPVLIMTKLVDMLQKVDSAIFFELGPAEWISLLYLIIVVLFYYALSAFFGLHARVSYKILVDRMALK